MWGKVKIINVELYNKAKKKHFVLKLMVFFQWIWDV